jgi:hypothetical protein
MSARPIATWSTTTACATRSRYQNAIDGLRLSHATPPQAPASALAAITAIPTTA